MLLTALHQYAKDRRLLDDLPLQSRSLHALISIDSSGKLEQDYLTPLSTPDEKGKETPGMSYTLPRFPGENNGGKAYFLAEGSVAMFGRDKTTGEPIAAPGAKKKKDDNPTKAFQHFWDQIEAAFAATNDMRLGAMLAYKRNYLHEQAGLIQCQAPVVRMRAKDKGKKQGELEFVANTGPNPDDYVVVEKSTFGFRVDGMPVALDAKDDPLREYWFKLFASQAFAEESDDARPNRGAAEQATFCLVTGQIGGTIARSHKPKILGVPGIAAGGYIVSFAKAAPAFSSYGFEMGENSPVSETAAASYALALMNLLNDEECHINLGPVAVCTWAEKGSKMGAVMNRNLTKAFPVEVKKFLNSIFVDDRDRQILNADRLYTIALTGNAGRVVIVHWINQTVAEAARHFKEWWDDLQIVPLFSADESPPKKKAKDSDTAEEPASPFALRNLAYATLRESKKQKPDKLVSERVVQLIRAAREGASLPITLLKPILDEFQSALLKNDPKISPFKLSRFALIKLILLRNRKEGDFMPEEKLIADTTDAAYNCGRLLAVLQELQNRSRNANKTKGERAKPERPNAGVIDRYYGRASTAPAQVFSILLGLSNHHLSRLQKGNEADKKTARALELRKIDILSRIRPPQGEPNAPPEFPPLLNLKAQGRFALGFYQQKAHDLEQFRKYRATQGQEGDDLADTDEE